MRFLTQAAKVLNEQKEHKRRLAVFLCLAAVVALGTVAALRMYGQAMSHKEKRLVCSVAAHQHTPECYNGGETVCGYADYMVHRHNDDCYDAEGGLACHLPEIEGHTHTDSCYGTERVLVCGEEESRPHQHTDGCYIPERGDLQCTIEEHTHGDSCYDGTTGMLVCDIEEHQHDDSCYIWTEALACGQTEGGHQHTAECYTREQRDLQCVEEEHTHGDECYNEDNELVCEIEEHQHSDDCYTWEEVLTCQQEEGPTGHTHSDGCYEEREVLTCGQLGLHVHDDSCYGEDGSLTCGMLQLEEHVHGEDCFEVVELTDEEVADKFGNDEGSVSGDEAGDVSGDDMGSVSADGAGSVSGDGMESSSDNAADSVSENEVPPIVKTYRDGEERYIVTASYHEDANIPEGAELRAEMITAEGNEEHYAERESEIRKTLEDESLSMNALFKIGFYMADQEIEPESDVTITVQFLDEKGLAEGSPIAIVHFADGDNKVLSGGKAKDKSTTFKTDSFSEFAIIEGVEVEEAEDVKKEETDTEKTKKPEQEKAGSDPDHIPISQTFEYKDDAYQITFRIKGDALIPESDEVRSTAQIISFGDEDKIIEGTQNEISSVSDDVGSKSSDTVSDEDDTDTEEKEKTAVSADGDIEMETSSGSSEEDAAGEEESSGESEEGSEESSGEVSGDKEDTAADGSESEEAEQQGLAFNVSPMDEDSPEYAAIEAYKETLDNKDAVFMTHALQYSLTYDGATLNIDECEVEADITPVGKLSEYVEDNDNETKVQVIAAEVSDDIHVNQLATMLLDKDTKKKNIQVALGNDGNNGIVMYSMDSVDPTFTVQYYAYLDVLKRGTEGTKLKDGNIVGKLDSMGNTVAGTPPDKIGVEVIDTSNGGNGSGGKLPTNDKGWALPRQYLYLDANKVNVDVNTTYDFIYEKDQLLKIFTEDQRNYWSYPQLENFNKFAKEKFNYDLHEIWVLKDGRNPNSITKEDWTVYKKEFFEDEDFEFTNNPDAEGVEKKIVIEEGTVIRLVGKSNKGVYPNEATFFDYDITSGDIYKKDNTGKLVPATRAENVDGKTQIYAYADQKGINSSGNYKKTGPKLAFGNFASIGLHDVQWEWSPGKNSFINKANGDLYSKCSFGLVNNALGKDGYPDFNVAAPNLFKKDADGEETKGKTQLDGYSLNFDRQGDTYTLSAVTGTELNALDKVRYTGTAWGSDRPMWVNLFWPLDDAKTHGTEGHDLKFGNNTHVGLRNALGSTNTTFPTTDNSVDIDHNSYFGMTFGVEFELTADYVGPLNYYFFGDDDMWVFLDDTLICDIGGVHQAAGEYVDLWDWIQKGDTRKHTLKFFYTERGASGSTCWMQFTLPSVSATPVDYSNGDFKNTLTVGKSVDGKPTDQAFEFTLNLVDKNGKALSSYYKYEILDKDGNKVDVEGGNNGITNGDRFKLKNGHSITVKGLPDGAKYTITETNYSGYIPVIDGDIKADGVDTGEIKWETDDPPEKVEYINRETTYELPETGGPGPIIYTIAGAVCFMFGAGFMYRKSLRERRR